MSGDSKAHLKNNIETLSNDLTNPFKHIRNWIKGEMLSLGALIHAISEKEACDVRKQQAIKKLSEDRELIQKLSQGKFTFKGMFKSANNKTKYQARVLERIA